MDDENETRLMTALARNFDKTETARTLAVMDRKVNSIDGIRRAAHRLREKPGVRELALDVSLVDQIDETIERLRALIDEAQQVVGGWPDV